MLAGYSEKINLNKSNRRSIVADLMDVAYPYILRK